MTKKKTTAKKTKPKRPPRSVYVCANALGVHVASETIKEAQVDAFMIRELFGPTLIYKYRLIDARPRGSVK